MEARIRYFLQKVLTKTHAKKQVFAVMHQRLFRTPCFLMTPPPAREHSFHISTCRPKVLQSDSKWYSFGTPWPSKLAKSHPKDPSKKHEKIKAIFDASRAPDRPQNDLKMGGNFFTLLTFLEVWVEIAAPVVPGVPQAPQNHQKSMTPGFKVVQRVLPRSVDLLLW